jgi:hypothetical protein
MYGTNTNNLFNSVECGSGTGIFSETISELDIYTRYYYKAYATNAFGTAYGEIMSFTLAPIDSISGTFQWEKVGGEMGTGLEEFGLFWQANNFSKSVNVNIKPIEDARLYILTPSDYAINDLYTLNTRLESVGESTLYNGVSADYCADYNDVIATVYNGRTYLINITRGTVSSDSIGMRFVITGTYKMWEQYVSNK